MFRSVEHQVIVCFSLIWVNRILNISRRMISAATRTLRGRRYCVCVPMAHHFLILELISALLECEEALNQGTMTAAEVYIILRSKIILHLFASTLRYMSMDSV